MPIHKKNDNVWKTTALSCYYQFVAKSFMKYGDSEDKPGDSCINKLLSITDEIQKSYGDGFDVRKVFLDQAFIQAVLLMSIFEQRLSFRMFDFMTITKLQ